MSYSDDDLDQAIHAGILSQKDVDGFRQFISNRHHAQVSSEEYFRLVTGFNDIFVSIAIMLVLGAAWYIGSSIQAPLGAVSVICLSWGLAEYFSRIRRMALPSILLLTAFVVSAFFVIPFELDDGWSLLQPIIAIGAAAIHWWRFKIPITIAAGMAAFSLLVLALFVEAGFDIVSDESTPILIGLGVMALAKAIWWDSRNPLRTSGHSDVAFWLHILSALLIVHPLFTAIDAYDTSVGIAMVFAIYLCLTLVSIILDRRALMVAALGYALYAASTVFLDSGNDELAYAFAAVTIGGGLLMLSALWGHVRKYTIRLLPEKITVKLPPA